VIYPIGLFGYIRGQKRYEYPGNGGFSAQRFVPGGWVFWEKPVVQNGGAIFDVLTHLQKKSKFGFLVFVRNRGIPWPTLHVWYHTQMQQRNAEDTIWLSNTEKGLYTRFTALMPLGWLAPLFFDGFMYCFLAGLAWMIWAQILFPQHRWDFEKGMIKTRGYFGGHWD